MSLRITSTLYQLARKLRDVEVASSGSPRKIVKHFLVNKFIMKRMVGGRLLRK